MPSPRGTVVFIHGLNQSASSFSELTSLLNQQGFHTFLPALHGYEDADPGHATTKQWIEDVRSALSAAKATCPTLPLHVVAYSLGSPLAVQAFEDPNITPPQSFVFLAPAFALTARAKLSRIFSWIAPLGSLIPSFSPEHYGRYRAIPAGWYTNLFELIDSTTGVSTIERLRKVPGLVLVREEDELVSASGIRNWLEHNHLDDVWRTESIPPYGSSYRHILLDEEHLGPEEWQRMTHLVVDFLKRYSYPSPEALNP